MTTLFIAASSTGIRRLLSGKQRHERSSTQENWWWS
jgi:hypothetical protein